MAEDKDKGVVYVAWGEKVKPELERSIASLPDGVPYHVIEPEEYDKGHGAKICMHARSPFRKTLFLDTDTVVLCGREEMDWLFDKAELHGMAIAHAPAHDANLQYGVGDGIVPQYNSGVIAWDREYKWKGCRKCRIGNLFEWWREKYDELALPFDQPSLALTLDYCSRKYRWQPFILPPTWNFRAGIANEGYGPIRIWHARQDPPEGGANMNGFWRTR